MSQTDRPARRKSRGAERPQVLAMPATRGRRPAPPPPAETPARLRASGYDLAMLATRVGAMLAGHDDRNDVNYYEWEAMRYFSRVQGELALAEASGTPLGAAQRRPMSAAGFGRYLRIHLTTATRTIRSLNERGFLSIKADAFDGKSLRGGYTIRLTRQGLEMMQNDPNVFFGHVLEREISADKRAAFVEVIETLMTTAAELKLRVSPSKK